MRLLPLFVLVGCVGGSDKPETGSEPDTGEACVPGGTPRLAVNHDAIDFGEIDAGYTLSAGVRLTNEGDVALGVSGITYGGERADFGVSWDLALRTSACATEDHVAGNAVIVLPPGCELDLTLSYSPVAAGGAADALVIPTVADPDGAYAADPLHAYTVVWVEGRTAGDLEGAAYVVGGVVKLGQTTLYEGESTDIEIRVFGPETPTVTWNTDDPTSAAFADPFALATTYTAPPVDAPGRNENLYAVIADTRGTDWAFGRIGILDESEPLLPCE